MRIVPSRVWLLAAAIVVSGCRLSNPANVDRTPKVVHSPPPAGAVQIDPQLQALAMRELLIQLESSDPTWRGLATEASADALGSSAEVQIVARLEDEKAGVRAAAAKSVGRLRLASARDRLLAMINDPQPFVRMNAAFALHKLGDSRFTRLIEEGLKDPSPQMRGEACLLAGMLGEKSACRLLRTLLKDKGGPEVHLQAAEALWRLGDEAGLSPLVAASLSPKAPEAAMQGTNALGMQMFALRALAEPGDARVLDHIRPAVLAEDPEVVLVAVRAMGTLDDNNGYGVALRLTSASSPRQRVLAALALGSIGHPAAQPSLAGLLKDSDPAVRIAAANAILILRPVE